MELTRFDFHVGRFMHSLDVMAMTDAEVGQYMLLLCHAWLTGQDTSLPVEEETLSRLARTTNLSPRVLTKFPIIQTERGERRRNDVLFAEWNKAKGRFESASRHGKNGNSVRWGTGTIGSPSGTGIAHTIPIHTKPNQEKLSRIQATIEAEDSSITLRKEEQARKNKVSEDFHKNHVL